MSVDSRAGRPLSERQVGLFRSQGHVVVPGVVGQDVVARLRAAHEALMARWSAECEVTPTEYERVVSQWTGLHEQSAVFAQQLHDPIMVAVARQLLGTDHIQLFHDHLISKPAGASATIPWHQDYPFWPVDRPRALSCWLALDDADEASGSMYFMPGAHLEGERAPVDFLRKQQDWGEREVQRVSTTVRAGDCVFHDCLSWHTSPPNRSTGPRRAYIVIILDADCRYDPAHSGWHPMNACVTAAPGERFNTDRFPMLGLSSLETVQR